MITNINYDQNLVAHFFKTTNYQIKLASVKTFFKEKINLYLIRKKWDFFSMRPDNKREKKCKV